MRSFALIDFFSGCLYNQFFRDALGAIDHEQHGDTIVGLPQLRFGQGQGQADDTGAARLPRSRAAVPSD